MRVTIDIPDELHKVAKLRAAREGTTLRQFVIEGIQSCIHKAENALKPFQIPVIDAKNPETLNLTNEQIDDILCSDLVDSARRLTGR